MVEYCKSMPELADLLNDPHFADPDCMLCIEGAMYGLPQAGRRFNQLYKKRALNFTFNDLTFVQSTVDPCIYIYRDVKRGTILIIGTHVDDGLYAHDDIKLLGQFMSHMKSSGFTLTDFEKVKHFLSVGITRNKDTVEMSQKQQVLKLLESEQDVFAEEMPFNPTVALCPRSIEKGEATEEEKRKCISLLGKRICLLFTHVS